VGNWSLAIVESRLFNHRLFIPFLILVFIALIQCNNVKDDSSSVEAFRTGFEAIDTLFDSGSILTLDFDTSRVELLGLSNENLWISNSNETPQFQRIQSVVIKNDHIHIVSAATGQLLKFNMDGDFLDSLGRFGEGPGEFRNLCCFVEGADSLIVYDSGLQRLTVYNDAYEVSNIVILKKHLGMTSESQFVFPDGRYLYNDLSEPNSLLHVGNMYDPEYELKLNIPRPVPPQKRPGVANMMYYSMGAHPNGSFYVGHNILPILYRIDSDFKISHTYFLKYPGDEKHFPYQLLDINSNSSQGYTGLFRKVKPLGDHHIMIARRNRFFIYDTRNSGKPVQVFEFPDRYNEFHFWPNEFTIHGSDVYFTIPSMSEIFKYQLNLLNSDILH